MTEQENRQKDCVEPKDSEQSANIQPVPDLPPDEVPPAPLEKMVLMQASGTDSEGQSE